MGQALGRRSLDFVWFHSILAPIFLALSRRNPELSPNSDSTSFLPSQSMELDGDGQTHLLLLRNADGVRRIQRLFTRSSCSRHAVTLVVGNSCLGRCSRFLDEKSCDRQATRFRNRFHLARCRCWLSSVVLLSTPDSLHLLRNRL